MPPKEPVRTTHPSRSSNSRAPATSSLGSLAQNVTRALFFGNRNPRPVHKERGPGWKSGGEHHDSKSRAKKPRSSHSHKDEDPGWGPDLGTPYPRPDLDPLEALTFKLSFEKMPPEEAVAVVNFNCFEFQREE
ncbi:hypothetical protein T439DRAFT_359995 [Meredithblackwellia eburnea MCA 4105]